MLFFSLFKTLVHREVTIECKNNISLRGTLTSVDQWMNMRLVDVKVVDDHGNPDLHFLKNVFIRGNVVRYIYLAAADVDVSLLHDATRSEAKIVMGEMSTLRRELSSFLKR